MLLILCLSHSLAIVGCVREEVKRNNNGDAIDVLCGADMLWVPSRKQLVIAGQKASQEFDRMLAAAHKSQNPNRTVGT